MPDARFDPLCPGFGLEAAGVDLSQPLSDAEFAPLERAFYAGQVLVLRGQALTPAQFVGFARRLRVHPSRTSSISFTTLKSPTS